MNTAQQATSALQKEDFYKAIAQNFLDFTLEQTDGNKPPISKDPEAAQLLDALAEICPEFPCGEGVKKLLFMYAAGLMRGLETGLRLTDTEQPETPI